MLALAEQTKVEGYEAKEPVPGAGGANVSVNYEPVEGGTGLSALVTLSPCDPFVCWDLDAEVTAEHEANLKSNLSRIHIDNPNLVFEYGTIQIASGYEAFYVYSRSFVAEGGSTSTTNSYRLLYHDGTNLISLEVSPEFGPLPESEDALEMEMDQAKGEMAARGFFAAFAGAFAPSE
jgi:hypothetical protein